MKLIRLATLYFDPPPEGWEAWQMGLGQCTVQTLPIGENPPSDSGKRLLVAAEMACGEPPDIGSDGLIAPPVALRKECERAIESVANVISVLTRSVRRVASPWPFLALVAENDLDHAHLSQARGFRPQHSGIRHRPHFSIEPSPKIIEGLVDRMDGVALVADLLAQSHLLGQYREAVRFLERAFHLPAVQVVSLIWWKSAEGVIIRCSCSQKRLRPLVGGLRRMTPCRTIAGLG